MNGEKEKKRGSTCRRKMRRERRRRRRRKLHLGKCLSTDRFDRQREKKGDAEARLCSLLDRAMSTFSTHTYLIRYEEEEEEERQREKAKIRDIVQIFIVLRLSPTLLFLSLYFSLIFELRFSLDAFFSLSFFLFFAVLYRSNRTLSVRVLTHV